METTIMFKKSASEVEIEQKQKSENGIQIGVQNNYGLSPKEAADMAVSIFREYFPMLRKEALDELNKLVATKLDKIPSENIVPPKARIAVPTLQNASITDEKEIRELYANLLANSMNKVVKDGVHPGFVEIIKQLSPDEARILYYLSFAEIIPTINLRYANEKGEGINMIEKFSDVGELADCEKPFDIPMYFDNLIRLGVITSAPAHTHLIDEKVYESLKNHSYITDYIKKHSPQEIYPEVVYVESFVYLNDFGKSFCGICFDANRGIIIERKKGE